jgi:hypothetical protein
MTRTLTFPASGCAGEVTSSSEAETTCISVPGTPSNKTSVAPEKLEPRIWTLVPPLAVPRPGVLDSTTGSGRSIGGGGGVSRGVGASGPTGLGMGAGGGAGSTTGGGGGATGAGAGSVVGSDGFQVNIGGRLLPDDGEVGSGWGAATADGATTSAKSNPVTTTVAAPAVGRHTQRTAAIKLCGAARPNLDTITPLQELVSDAVLRSFERATKQGPAQLTFGSVLGTTFFATVDAAHVLGGAPTAVNAKKRGIHPVARDGHQMLSCTSIVNSMSSQL